MPDSSMCSDGSTAARCSADGAELKIETCPAERPICVGDGQCVECGEAGDCDDPGECRVKSCNLATGTCEPQLAAPASGCSGGGKCNRSGDCVMCFGSADENGNACGGCATLTDAPGASCQNGLKGDCAASGRYRCVGSDAVECDAPRPSPGIAQCGGGDEDCDGDSDETATQNACGGCGSLSGTLGASCDGSDADQCKDGKMVCNGTSSLRCDDNSSSTKETCNGQDDDCDGKIDENVTNVCGGCTTLSGTLNASCDGSDADQCKDGKMVCQGSNALVCNDASSSSNEVCDGSDNDCDGKTDEGVKPTWYRDDDGDGYGTSSATNNACSAPPAYVSRSGDCCDSDNRANPGATTWRDTTNNCNSYDWNCNGKVDLQFPSRQSESCENANGCDATPGWQGSSVPSCGQNANYLTACTKNGAFCMGSVSGGKKQYCR